VKAFPGTEAEADRHVDRVAGEVGIAERGLELDPRLRVRALEVRKVRNEPALAERLEGRDAQRTRRREPILRRLELRERSVNRREIGTPLLGKLEARVQPPEQRHAEVILERSDLARERRCGHVQLLRRELE
jgi:hypothetical protein